MFTELHFLKLVTVSNIDTGFKKLVVFMRMYVQTLVNMTIQQQFENTVYCSNQTQVQC